jgi:hypothetical protein
MQISKSSLRKFLEAQQKFWKRSKPPAALMNGMLQNSLFFSFHRHMILIYCYLMMLRIKTAKLRFSSAIKFNVTLHSFSRFPFIFNEQVNFFQNNHTRDLNQPHPRCTADITMTTIRSETKSIQLRFARKSLSLNQKSGES